MVRHRSRVSCVQLRSESLCWRGSCLLNQLFEPRTDGFCIFPYRFSELLFGLDGVLIDGSSMVFVDPVRA